MEAQSLSVKRASVEFHNFASLGEPERAIAAYAEENVRRGGLIRKHLDYLAPISPFLEIGANAAHTSYMLANEFGADGFALDLSADSLRHGMVLQEKWGMPRTPILMAGDAVHLPFRDGSLRVVLAYQMLSQFMSIETVFLEVKRVLAPGGIFVFAEEPLRRMLSLRLYRCAYYASMKPWERKLSDWGLLGYLVKDVIGADQEESFGIRQNHSMGLKDWHHLIRKHFADARYDIFAPERGWGERVVKRVAVALDPYRSQWRAARLLGGTLAAMCRKAGDVAELPDMTRFEELLRCPDCKGTVTRDLNETLLCTTCGYTAELEGGVYNLLASRDRRDLYPGDRDDVVDFGLPSHDKHLLDGWYALEGVFGNKYRWIGARASLWLKRVASGPQRLRIRGHLNDQLLRRGARPRIRVLVNGEEAAVRELERSGLFVIEADVPDSPDYRVEIEASPTWTVPTDERVFTVNISMIRLIPAE